LAYVLQGISKKEQINVKITKAINKKSKNNNNSEVTMKKKDLEKTTQEKSDKLFAQTPQDNSQGNENELTKKEDKKKKDTTLWQAIKFVLFSCSAGVIQFVSATVLEAILGNWVDPNATVWFMVENNTITFIAQTVGLCLSIIWNFLFNRKFTFKDASNVPIAMLLAFVFYIPFYPFQTWYITTVQNALLAKGLSDVGTFVIAQGTCMVCNFVLEFLWQKFVVFRKPKTENTPKAEEKGEDILATDIQPEQEDKN